jgi:hypothetical protein
MLGSALLNINPSLLADLIRLDPLCWTKMLLLALLRVFSVFTCFSSLCRNKHFFWGCCFCLIHYPEMKPAVKLEEI